jgi:hypothetical protein
MELQEIEVFIDQDGRVHIEVRGAKGMSCLEVTKGLEEALGGQLETRQMTSEAYETAPEHIQEQQWQRGG